MSAREWKPGDVAMVQITEAHGPEVGVSSGQQWFVAGPRLGSQHGWYHDRVKVIRPLVVIDPENPEQVERLARVYREQTHAELGPYPMSLPAYRMQSALREFANPTAVTVEQPTNLYAVVRDRDDREWCHIGGQVWRSLTSTGAYMVEKHWDDLAAPLAGNAAALLSEGVTA